jgi:hypothetical protein
VSFDGSTIGRVGQSEFVIAEVLMAADRAGAVADGLCRDAVADMNGRGGICSTVAIVTVAIVIRQEDSIGVAQRGLLSPDAPVFPSSSSICTGPTQFQYIIRLGPAVILEGSHPYQVRTWAREDTTGAISALEL